MAQLACLAVPGGSAVPAGLGSSGGASRFAFVCWTEAESFGVGPHARHRPVPELGKAGWAGYYIGKRRILHASVTVRLSDVAMVGAFPPRFAGFSPNRQTLPESGGAVKVPA